MSHFSGQNRVIVAIGDKIRSMSGFWFNIFIPVSIQPSLLSMPSTRSKRLHQIGVRILLSLAWVCFTAAVLWALGALIFDLNGVVAGVFLILTVGLLLRVRGRWKKLAMASTPFALVLAWWFTQQPRQDRVWQADVAELAWADINGDEITLHNIRNFDYRTETDYTPRWETRKVRLSQLTGADLFINYWGSPWMAHPIVSFQFADAPPICFSIETRKEVGESYSAIGGIYRQYELIYTMADERDVVRLRTNYRKGEDAYLYRTTIKPERARERFMEYMTTINELREQPRWYNAITTNCTTAIRSQHPSSERLPWDWRLLVNGKGDEMLYERRGVVTDGLPFSELREKALINSTAQKANESPDFSRVIRENRPGFPAQPRAEAAK